MKSQKKEIALRIDGSKLTADKFISAVTSFFELIREVGGQVQKKSVNAELIVNVRAGSTVIAVSPSPSLSEKFSDIAKVIRSGLAELESGDDRPLYFTDKALESVKTLARIRDPKHHAIEVVQILIDHSTENISSEMVASVDNILRGRHESIGSIEGKLEVISGRKEFHCFVFDALTDQKVYCHVDEKNEEIKRKILGSFGKRVAVYGLVKYRKDGTPANIVVDDIRIFRDPTDLPSLDQLQGIFKGK